MTLISIHLDLPYMPTTTSQQKGYNRLSGHFYEKPQVRDARKLYEGNLMSFRPTSPLCGPLKVSVTFTFPTKTKKQQGQPKSTRPDVDNIAKLFLDCCTRCRYWFDDAQVADLHIAKRFDASASIDLTIEPYA